MEVDSDCKAGTTAFGVPAKLLVLSKKYSNSSMIGQSLPRLLAGGSLGPGSIS